MLRSALKTLAIGLVLALLWLVFVLGNAHLGIRRENPPLPGTAEVFALAAERDLPIRLSWIETARQCTSDTEGLTCIVHPVFVLEWADGRLLLVDAGMEAEAARKFGRPMELLLGNEPTRPGRSVAEALDVSRWRVQGLVFTHLHVDHTQGIAGLCPPGAAPLAVFLPPAQADRPNYTVVPGHRQVKEAPCAERVEIADSGLARLGTLTGVAAVRAAGHTPGSQIVVAWVGATQPRGYLLAGDVVFAKSAIDENRPKALPYRLLVTPESEAQLERVRAWLHRMETVEGLTPVPSHDLAFLEGLELPRFAP